VHSNDVLFVVVQHDAMIARYMLSSCVGVFLSHTDIVSKRLNLESHKQRHIPWLCDSSFLTPNEPNEWDGVISPGGDKYTRL